MEQDKELPPVAEEKAKSEETKESQPKPKSQDEQKFTDWALI